LCTLVTLEPTANVGARQVIPVILVVHMSHAITQSFENSQKSVFCRNLDADLSMKGWFARVAQRGT
jgi:hypothetical protein